MNNRHDPGTKVTHTSPDGEEGYLIAYGDDQREEAERFAQARRLKGETVVIHDQRKNPTADRRARLGFDSTNLPANGDNTGTYWCPEHHDYDVDLGDPTWCPDCGPHRTAVAAAARVVVRAFGTALVAALVLLALASAIALIT